MRSQLAGTALALGLCGSGAAAGLQSLAAELSKAARSAGVARVAVLPFVPEDGSKTREGWGVAEELTTHLVRTGKVQVVERSLLPAVMEEQKLAETGAIDSATRRKLGKLLAGGVIVTGSFLPRGREILVNARMIDVETGVVLGAAEGSAERRQPRPLSPAEAGLWVQVPALDVPAPAFLDEEERDSLDASCEAAAETVDRLESRILEIKARYWALRLKSGEPLTDVKANPGSTITDPFLKQRFYELMKYWYGMENAPSLTPAEVKRFVTYDRQAYTIFSRCGVSS